MYETALKTYSIVIMELIMGLMYRMFITLREHKLWEVVWCEAAQVHVRLFVCDLARPC